MMRDGLRRGRLLAGWLAAESDHSPDCLSRLIRSSIQFATLFVGPEVASSLSFSSSTTRLSGPTVSNIAGASSAAASGSILARGSLPELALVSRRRRSSEPNSLEHASVALFVGEADEKCSWSWRRRALRRAAPCRRWQQQQQMEQRRPLAGGRRKRTANCSAAPRSRTKPPRRKMNVRARRCRRRVQLKAPARPRAALTNKCIQRAAESQRIAPGRA